MLTLPFGQFRREFEDVVTLRNLPHGFQRLEQVAGQFAGAGTGFGDDGGRGDQHRGDTARQGLPKQGRHFRRRDEVTAPAEFAGTAAVIPQTRRIEGQFHILRKRNPAAGLINGTENLVRERPAMRLCIHIRLRQRVLSPGGCGLDDGGQGHGRGR